MNVAASELYEHYKAVRSRLGYNLPIEKQPKNTKKKRDVINLNPVYNVIKFVANKTPDELFDAEVHDRLPRVSEIVNVVCQEYNLSKAVLLSRQKTNNIIIPRHIVCYLARNCSLKSLPEIGRALGGRDHSTIINAVNRIEDLTTRDKKLLFKVNELQRRLMVVPLAHKYWGA